MARALMRLPGQCVPLSSTPTARLAQGTPVGPFPWELEEPHLHEPVSKSGKPREEKRSMIQWAGGKGSPGVITLMNPGPYWPLYLWGFHLGGVQASNDPPPAKGGF